MLSEEEGIKAVRIAREVIENFVSGKKIKIEHYPEVFKKKLGVFVTINTHPENELRGCIGYPEPIMPLINALVDAAQNACNDPRFEPLQERELDKIVIEASVLTTPELIVVNTPNEYVNKIKIGADGLIAERGYFRGLLLPQVAVEWNWDEEEFLSHTCMKSGLPPDAWLQKNTKIYKFQAQIFSEQSPRGKIVERTLVQKK